ncbi:type I DNA topoisomerase [Congzhengia minquanensis]|uniref:DNA topoisomerase 1 n=1 Tax=Congzhengia minquanensis TaxID=2763657 RepID=A0A926DP05_9FIRM|nr:type I DNA topoisomerase [Congzhengia minquanensis]MBC8540704.1 type I DNA topoisomerase [Congzhengia minquanensis]
MANNLVIVESPAKAKTIKQYLGKSYNVVASMGHIRDLPKSQMGVDLEHHFEPKYITIRGKGELLSKLKKEAKNAKKIYLATDPDREGEAISWHLAKLLNIDETSNCRITFNEITKNAVQTAIKEPRPIDLDLVNAQQARRVLDRIVGYQISPILWRKVKKGLSAGRVQSVATRLIVDREREIENFIPEEYWTVDAKLKTQAGEEFEASLNSCDGKKIKPEKEPEVKAILDELAQQEFVVDNVKKGEKKRNPAPPFTTSTLQQEASRKLNFTVKRTMMAAQKLYEGAAVEGHGTVGLITYMRTDSLRLSNDAIADAREEIKTKYGDALLPGKPNVYKTKNSAQDAHEAIRPTYASIKPADLKESLPADMYKLYKLIWERFIACQMKPAVYETVNADIKAGRFGFKASGSKLVFKGYMSVYVEGRDDDKTEKDKVLPPLSKDEILKLLKLLPNQHFTQPPQRFTEATLIKMLEEKGIGRPSTYAPTITTITARGYVTREKKQLLPTELGSVVTDIMTEHFPNIVGIAFTADMEKDLDEIEEGEIDWVKIVEDFYGPFEKTLKTADEKIGKVKIEDEKSDVICEKCGRTMVYKMGRFGKFLACPGFPECRNAKPIVKETGADCPKCGKKILEKKSKTGKTYFGCEDNPKCDFMTWDMPVAGEKCPKCGGLLLSKKGKKKQIVCANPDCGYTKE